MRRSIFICLMIVTMYWMLARASYADSYRCGRKLVREGDSTARLLTLCGEPRFKDSGTEKIHIKGSLANKRVQRWHYKKNSRSLERIVLIYSGNIVGIKTGSR